MKLKVLTYNLLAPCHVVPERYPNVKETDLSWDARKHRILQTLEEADPHVICLQEIEPKGYSFLDSALSPKGYRGIHALKGFSKLEGAALFFKFEKLLFTSAEVIYYHDYYPDRLKQIPFASGDFVLIVYFKTTTGIVGITTTHAHAFFSDVDSPEKNVNKTQMDELFNTLIPARKFVDHWIVTGDFNTEPEKLPKHLLEQNHFLDAHKGNEAPTFEDMKIDYIFHSDSLAAKPAPTRKMAMPMPNAEEGSDHLPLMATFDLAHLP